MAVFSVPSLIRLLFRLRQCFQFRYSHWNFGNVGRYSQSKFFWPGQVFCEHLSIDVNLAAKCHENYIGPDSSARLEVAAIDFKSDTLFVLVDGYFARFAKNTMEVP